MKRGKVQVPATGKVSEAFKALLLSLSLSLKCFCFFLCRRVKTETFYNGKRESGGGGACVVEGMGAGPTFN